MRGYGDSSFDVGFPGLDIAKEGSDSWSFKPLRADLKEFKE